MYVLAVDDERLALDALLNELGKVFPDAEIHGEKNPLSAVEWMRGLKESGGSLQYAFLDINMKNLNGLELAKIIKTLYPNAYLFFCTAYSEYALDAFGLYAKGYLMKPISAESIEKTLDEMVYDWRAEPSEFARDIRIQTFGNFEVFVDGKPLIFEKTKAKELFAYLVDRHGASVTTEQIALVLWENSLYDKKSKNMTTTIVASLKKTLKTVGLDGLLIKSWNHLSLDVSKVKCDAYDYEKGDAVAVNSFRGEYMANYSWAEFTTGNYVFKKNDI